MPNFEPNTKVSLEDLLRLKRAERPSPEFWANFDRELHQKQLTALVKKRRWWHELPRVLSRRVYVPAGAAAVVAFSLVTVRYAGSGGVMEIQNKAPQIASADPSIEMLAPTVVESSEIFSSGKYEESVVAVAPQSVPDVADSMPVMLAPREVVSPSARSIAANLARLEQSEPELVNSVMGNRLSSPARVQMVASAQSEEESAATSDSGRKYRLIARYADRALSPEPAAPASVRERIARRLGDDLVDDISRIGVKGSRVSLKF